MTDPPPYRTPRWVKIVGIIALVLVVLVGILLLAGIGGEHGPGRHMPSGGAGGHTPPASVIEDYTSSGGRLGRHTPPRAHGVQ